MSVVRNHRLIIFNLTDEGVVVRGEVVVVGVENIGIKMKPFGIGLDHGVEGEEGGVVIVVEDLGGIVNIGCVKGNGGNKLAMEVGVVKNALNNQLGMYLLHLFQCCAWI